MNFKQRLGILVAAGLITTGVQAAVIAEVEPNDSLATAQNIDAFFTLDFSPNIGDVAGNNTSTTIPHVTINATGNATFDYFSFTVPSAGTVGIFDIDFGMPDIDTELAVWTSAGLVLAENDDFSITAGAGGSSHPFDAFIQLVFATTGTHIVGVARFPSGATATGWTGNTVQTGADYTLQVSIEQFEAPEPGSLALISLALAGLGIVYRRRRIR